MLTNNNNNRINIQSSQLEKYLPNLQLVQLVADEDSNLTLIKKRTRKNIFDGSLLLLLEQLNFNGR